eukprot:COSAG01_NODE_15336_length_1348_cov_1.190552_2_plen_122_part_00
MALRQNFQRKVRVLSEGRRRCQTRCLAEIRPERGRARAEATHRALVWVAIAVDAVHISTKVGRWHVAMHSAVTIVARADSVMAVAVAAVNMLTPVMGRRRSRAAHTIPSSFARAGKGEVGR